MSESTVNFGLDVTTGDSTSTVDKLTGSVEGLLAKYTQLMTAMGDGDKVFANVVKALGGHKGELDAAAREIDKVQKAMSGGTAKAMTSDLGSEFKTLAQDLKTAFAGIPVEIKTATVQITGMATVMQNQLGGIGVTLRELKDSLLDVGNIADNTKRKTAQIQGKPKIEGQAPDLGTSLANKFNLEAKVQFKTEEDTLKYIQDIVQQADKLDAILKSAEKNELIDSVKARQAQSIVNTLKLSMTDLKVANIDMAGEAGRAMTELNSKISQTNTKLKEVKSITADKYVLSLKIDVPDIKDLKANIAAMSQSVGTDTIKTSTLDQLISKQKELINLRKEAAYLKSAEDKTAVSAMLLPLQKEIGLRKDNIQKAKELNAVVAEQVKEFERSEATKKQKASEYFRLTSSWLKQQTLEQEQADNRRAIVSQNLAQAKLRIAAQEKTQTYTDEYKKAGDDLTKLGNLSTKITKELTEDQKNLGLVTRNATKETVQALKEELAKREALVRTIKEQSAAQSLGIGASRGGEADKVKKLQDAFDVAKQATEEFGKTSQSTIFQSIADMKSYHDQIITVREELVKQKKLFEDPEILGGIDAQLKKLDKLKESLKFLTKGLDDTGTGFAPNTEAIRLKEEIDLLNKYQDITDRVRQTKEKLNQTKGTKSDTLQARKEMEALRVEQERLKKEMQGTAALFAAAGMTGSKAMRDIANASSKLNNEMASLKGTISTTESSFKNMWGSMTMALGKFMLIYHTFSIGFGALRGMFNGLVTSLNEIMTVGEKFSNVQKVFRSIEGSNKSAAGEDWARLTAQAERYGMAISDLAEPYQKWIMTMKATNMNIKEGWMLFEHMIASARPLGVTDPQGMSEYFAGLTQMISKGKANMEDFRQQLAEKIPGLYFSVKEAVAKAMKIDPKVFDFEGMVKKGSIPLNALLVAIDTSLLKFAQLGETVADSYSANVNRMKNAWETFLAQMSAGPVGSKINSIVTDLTKALSNKDFQNALAQVASGLASIAGILVKLATVALPALSAQIRQFVGDKRIAESNPELYAATQRETEARRPKNVVDMLNGNKMWTPQEQQTLTSDIVSSDLIASIRKGYIYAEDGTLKKSASATEALTHQLKVSDEELNSNFDTLVLQPLLKTMEKQGKSFAELKKDMFDFAQELSIKAGGIYDEGSLLKAQESFVTDQKINKAGYSTTGIGYNDRLYGITKDTVSEEFARNTQQESMATFKNQEAVFLNSLRASSQALEQASDAALKMSPAYSKFLRDNPLGKQLTYGTQTAITETGLSEVDKGESEAEKTKRENMERSFRAEMERLDGALSAAQAGGSWASKIQKVANQANVKDITAEKFTPEMQAQLDVKRNAAVAAQQTDLYSQAMQQLESIDAEIEARIAAGSLKNELKTQYEDIIKWQIKTTNDLEKNYGGLDGVNIGARVAKIQQAVERASEQALTQGNTPMEIIAKAEERAAKGRTDAWQSTHKELVDMEQGFSGVQIEQQFGLMQTLDEIAGTRGEKEKQRINEAAEIDKRNFKNTENMAVAQALRLIAVDEDTYNKRKAIFGELYDAATTDADNIAIEKLNTQFQGLQDTFGNTIPLIKEYDRSLQAITDRQVDKKIANASNFTEYLNTRFSKEQGLFDNQTVATTKNFEKMYEVIGSGASEAGQTIQTAFTDAFMGTLKSWTDVWKSIQATFLKGLAAMLWEAKAKPIQLSIVSALTGVTPAIAGGSTAGQAAAQAHDMVTGGSQTTEGVFTKLSKGIDEMTKSLNDFGKETLGLSTDLTNAITGGALGFAIGSMMFPDNVTAKIGAAIGGAAGEVIGETYGGPIGGAIGSAAGSVIGGAIGKFFSGEKKITDYGIRVSVDDDGLKFLDKYEKIKKSSSFNLSAVFKPSFYTDPGSAWSVGNKKEKYSDVDPQVYKQISAAITTSFSTVSRQMLSLGLAPNFAGFSIDEKVSLKGKDPEALLQAWLNKLSGKMVDTALANDSVQASFAAAKKMGETSSDALTRLVEAMTALESGAIKANVSIDALAGGLSGMDLASFASDFSEALGGSSNVTAFFNQIAEFIGYIGIEGIANMTRFEEKFQTAIGNINSYSNMSGTRTSTLLGQQTELGLTQSSIESKLEKFAAGAGWKKWLTFQDNELTMRPGSKYSTVEEMAAADPKWKAVLEPMIAYVKELKVTNQALENVSVKLEREGTAAPVATINASSTTFWADYKKALTEAGSTGLPPELASAWFEAGKVAEQIKEMGDAAKEAAEKQRDLMAAYKEQSTIAIRASEYMGLSSQGLLEISKQAQELNQNDLPAWFKANKEQIYNLVPGLQAFSYEGETALDTFNRLGTVLMEISDAAGITGTSLSTISGGLEGIDLAGFAQGLVDTFGSSGAVVEALQRYNNLVNTTEQQKTSGVDYWKQQATERMKPLGITEIDTTSFAESYKKAMEQGLTSEELYKWDYAAQAMENMADAAGEVAEVVSGLADYLRSIREEIEAFGMTDTESFLKDAETRRQEMVEKIIELSGISQEDVTSGKISVPDTAIADEWYQAALTDKISQMMEEAVKALNIDNMTDYDQKIQAIEKTTQDTIDSLKLLKASEEDVTKIRQYETLQIKKLQEAHTEYVQSIQDKIDDFGLTDTESFLKTLTTEVNDMKKQLLETGGALADTTIAESYRIAAVQDKLASTMQGITDSIGSLANSGYVNEIQKINKVLQESITDIIALGGAEEDLAQARYLAQLQAQEIIKEAANAYISAYDDKLQEIEDLKNEKQALIDAVSTARNNYMQALKEEIDLKQESINKMQETIDSLKSFVSSMEDLKSSLLSDAGFLSSAEKAGAAMANFQKLVSKAKGGDEEARSGLSGAASSAIESAKGGSYENYIKTFAQVYGQINSVQASAQADLDKMTPELEALTASRDALQAIYDKLKAEEEAVLSTNDANTAYENAKIALANSSLDVQIAAAQAEADRHKETVELLRLQYDETVSLTSAARNYFDTINEVSTLGLGDTLGMVTQQVEKSAAIGNIVNATQATEKALNASVDIAFKTSKIQDSIYKKTDELLYFMQEDNKKLYKLISETYYGTYRYDITVESEIVSKTDIGLKVIVSATQVKDSILLALREANNLDTVDSTSVIGLLKGIKTCSCECQCSVCSLVEYNEEGTNPCTAVNSVIDTADSAGLADTMTDKAFSTVPGGLAFAATELSAIDNINFNLGTEDPDCSNYTYFILTVGA